MAAASLLLLHFKLQKGLLKNVSVFSFTWLEAAGLALGSSAARSPPLGAHRVSPAQEVASEKGEFRFETRGF